MIASILPGVGNTAIEPDMKIFPHPALGQDLPFSPLSNWPSKKRGLLFAISDALRTRAQIFYSQR
jgi:hypothetical protein